MPTKQHCPTQYLIDICHSLKTTERSERTLQEQIDRASLRQRFDTLDRNNDGFIDINDYPIAYQNQQDLRKRLTEMDLNADGKISFEEFFICAVTTFDHTRYFFEDDGRIKWRSVFEYYDLDNSGFLEVPELHTAFVDSGQMTSDELQQLIKEMDSVEKDNRISFLEFLLYHIRQTHFLSPPLTQERLSRTA